MDKSPPKLLYFEIPHPQRIGLRKRKAVRGEKDSLLKTTHRVLTCEVSELRYFNAWQPRIPAKSTCGGYTVELVLGSTLVNVLV